MSKTLSTALHNISILPLPFQPQTDHALIEAKGAVAVDVSSAVVTYYNNALVVGGVFLRIHFDYLYAQIFWNELFGIPKYACVVLADVCGQKFQVCWDIDLGVAHIDLPLQDLELPVFLSLQHLWFKQETGKYELFAEPGLELVGEVIATLPGTIARGIIHWIENALKSWLEGILGTGALAELFIDLLLLVWNLADIAIRLADTAIGLTWEAVAEPIASVLQKLVDDALNTHIVEVDLQQSIPSTVVLAAAYSETDSAGNLYQHAAVELTLAGAPAVEVQGGLVVRAEVQ